MREFYKASLNGEEFNSIDPRVYINDIVQQAKLNVETAKRPHYGQTLISPPSRSELAVEIHFMVKEKNRATRQRIIDKVNAWAVAPGWLRLSTMTGKQLYVVCTQSVNAAAHRWSDELRLTLTAFDGPYWQEQIPVKATLTGADGSVILRPPGSRRCLLNADIRNVSGGTINTLSVSANGCTLTFHSLELENGQTLAIYHDPQGRLHAEIGSTTKLHCRTPASADDVPLAPVQDNTVSLSAGGKCEVTFYARGEWQ